MLKFDRSQYAKLLVVLAVGIFTLAATGCASQPPKEIKDGLTVRVKVGPNLNPNATGKPAPVFVRIYQLSDKTAFEQASYGELASDDKATLGSSLLARRDIEVCPSEFGTNTGAASSPGCPGQAEFELTLDRMTKAEYVAVVVEFYHLHDPQGNWRAVTSFREGATLVINLERSSVSVGFE